MVGSVRIEEVDGQGEMELLGVMGGSTTIEEDGPGSVEVLETHLAYKAK